MELLAAPPAELAAIADPSAPGAAPLLRAPGARGRGPPAAVPFELLLGLLTEPLPGGESWPASGKKWPLPRLPGLPESMAAMALAPGAGSMPALAGAAAAAPAPAAQAARHDLPAVPVAQAPSATDRPAAWLPAPSASAAPAPVGRGEPPVAAQLAVLDGLAAADAEAAPVEAPHPAEVSSAAGPEPDGVERLLSNDARLRAQWSAAAPGEPRPGALPAAPPAAAASVPLAPAEAQVSPVRDRPPAPPSLIRRLDSFGTPMAPPTGGEGPAGVALDWLPAHGHGPTGTAGTAAAPPPALPNAPVDARLPGWHEAFAQRVQWLVDTEAGEARIKLNPPELGAVDVKISLVDDKTHVHLTASTAAARDELAQSLPRLRELFTVSGLELGSASVHDGRGEHASRGGHHARNGDAVSHARAVAPLAGLLDEPASGVRGPARGRIDVFA